MDTPVANQLIDFWAQNYSTAAGVEILIEYVSATNKIRVTGRLKNNQGLSRTASYEFSYFDLYQQPVVAGSTMAALLVEVNNCTP